MAIKLVKEIPWCESVPSGEASLRERIQFNSANYNGSLTVYIEGVFESSATNGYFIVKNSNGDDEQQFYVDAVYSTPTRRRYTYSSYNNTYPLKHYQKLYYSSFGWKTLRLLVLQDAGSSLTATESQISIGTAEWNIEYVSAYALQPYPKFWLYTAANWDGTKTFYWEVVHSVENSSKVTAYFELVRTTDFSAYTQVDSFTSTAELDGSGLPAVTRRSFTPVDGYYYTIRRHNDNGKYDMFIYNARVVVVQTGTITKTESTFLLLNTAHSEGGLRHYDQYYDPANWSDVTINWYHEISINQCNDAHYAKLQSNPNGTPADITNSTASDSGDTSGVAKLKRAASAMTMPTANEIDTYIISYQYKICSSRMVAIIAVSTGPATLTIGKTESVSIVESVAASVSAQPTISPSKSEVVSLTEAVKAAVSIHISVVDGLTLVEGRTVEVSAQPTHNVSAVDSISIPEVVGASVSTAVTLNVDTVETVTISEDALVSVSAQPTLDISAVDTVALNEVVAAFVSTQPTLEIGAVDLITLVEARTVYVEGIVEDREISVVDALSVIEDVAVSVSTQPTLLIDVMDSPKITEVATVDVSAQPTLTIDRAEVISLSELVSVYMLLSVEVSDSVSLVEDASVSVSTQPTLDVGVLEVLGLVEVTATFVSVQPLLTIDVYDFVALVEARTVVVEGLLPTLEINVSQSLILQEQVSALVSTQPTLTISSADALVSTEVTEVDVNTQPIIYVDKVEVISITEARNVYVVPQVPLAIQKVEQLRITEARSVFRSPAVTVSVNVSEQVKVSEGVSAFRQLDTINVNVAQSFLCTEVVQGSVSAQPVRMVSVADAVKVSEERAVWVLAPGLHNTSVLDVVGISEQVNVQIISAIGEESTFIKYRRWR